MSERAQRALALVGAAVFYVVIVLVAWGPDLSWADWGDVPTWTVGAVALAGLLVALRAGATANELLRAQRQGERERADRETRAQASLVSSWIDVGYARDALGDPVAVERLSCSLRNASALPVHDVRVTPVLERPSSSGRRELTAATVQVGTLPPGDAPLVQSITGPVVIAMVDEAAGGAEIGIRCAMTFTDAAGVRWTRLADGGLEPAQPAPE